MDEAYLYQQIAGEIRTDILEGRLQPGDRLASIRDMTRRWNCTPGTVQRAYQELARQGLVVSQAGKGTHVSSQLDLKRLRSRAPLRRAGMVHRAEAFLLEMLTAGNSLDEIQQAFSLAMDRWRALQTETAPSADQKLIRFNGSHDMAVVWMSAHVDEIAPGARLQLTFTGSLGGLLALAEGKTELAGSHLWDVDTDTYNDTYVRKLFPGKEMLLVRLASRKIGLIVAPNNPLDVRRVGDLARPSLRFVNRQTGSGTRVWLDAVLRQAGLDAAQIDGYANEKITHSEVARDIAENQADVGIGLESAAAAFDLGFEPLTEECYDLVTYAALAEREPLASLFGWLAAKRGIEKLATLKGYDFSQAGARRIIS